MKVIACPVDNGGVGHYRLKQPIEVLQKTESHIDVEIAEELPVTAHPSTQLITGFADLDCDVLILQVPMMSWMPDAITDLQKRGIKVIVEVDDDFESLDANHMSFHLVHPKTSPFRNWKHLKECCKRADLVTCSTPALANRYGYGNGLVLRNYVPKALLDIPRHKPGEKVIVGWPGGTGVHPNDLQVTRGGVAQAVFETEAHFLCIGSGAGVKSALNLYEEPETTEWVDFDLYPTVLSRFDVGIAPLANTRFNACKSWLKGLEYAALGIPFVASNVIEYVTLASYGIVGTCVESKAKLWRRELKRLISDDHYRLHTGEQNRARVREALTIEDNAWRWADAWESVLTNSAAYHSA